MSHIEYRAISAKGKVVSTFDDEQRLRDWVEDHPNHRVKMQRVTITEEVEQLDD